MQLMGIKNIENAALRDQHSHTELQYDGRQLWNGSLAN